jgi:diguanylate cyclase (GGDEF)-like protein
MLLILAVIAAGGLLLLDLWYFHPQVLDQKWSFLREEALEFEKAGQGAVLAERRALTRVADAWGNVPDIVNYVDSGTGVKRIDEKMTRLLAPPGPGLAWLLGPEGKVLRAWKRTAQDHRVQPVTEADADIAAALRSLQRTEEFQPGVIDLSGDAALFTCAPVASAPDGGPATLLCLADRISGPLQRRLSLAVGGDFRFIRADEIPTGQVIMTDAALELWLTGSQDLAAAWAVRDLADRQIGYFKVQSPVTHIHRQAELARRTVLITGAVALALMILLVVAIHIFVAAPVVRLLNRLQHIEGGSGQAEDLSRDMHGEPLVLARRLQSAFEKLAYLSKTDQLTGLANRRHFEEVLEYFYNQARRYNRPLSVLVLDVDYFKAVNDSAGHQAGDRMLAYASDEIRRACRKADLPARIGGDEFAVLLPETESDAAVAMAERIRSAVPRRPLSVRNTEINVTVSIGVADLFADRISSPHELMSLADRALYRAKEQGRNCIFQARDLIDSEPPPPKNAGPLKEKLAGLNHEFKGLFLRAIEQVAGLLERRDPHMADHATKVKRYAVLIAREMDLPERMVNRLEIAAALHDIGMLLLPDSILLCPGGLDLERLEEMKSHAVLGARMMGEMSFLDQEVPAVRHHHERWDGEGYPDGLSGANIPLGARILSVADCFDAMTSPRVFRDAKSAEQALNELRRGAGKQFDPGVVEAFLQVAERLGDDLMIAPSTQESTPAEDYIPTGAQTLGDPKG